MDSEHRRDLFVGGLDTLPNRRRRWLAAGLAALLTVVVSPALSRPAVASIGDASATGGPTTGGPTTGRNTNGGSGVDGSANDDSATGDSGVDGSAADATARRPLSWRAERTPFRLLFGSGGRQVTAQAPGALAGPGGRMAYQLRDGSTHRLTSLVRAARTPRGVTYTVATDEAARTATVAVTRTPRGLRVAWSLQPPTDVTQVYETLVGTEAEHFLGGGAHTIFVDLRRRVLLNKALFAGASVFGTCNKNGAPSPFFLSSAGYGIFPDTTAVGRVAFPNAAEDPPHCIPAAPPPCPVSLGVPDRIQLCFKADRLDYEVYAGSPARSPAPTRRGRAARHCRRRASSGCCSGATPPAGRRRSSTTYGRCSASVSRWTPSG